MKKRQKTVRRVWLLEVREDKDRGRPKKTYLHYVGGDWGPDHMVYESIDGALEFDSYVAASRYAREHHRGLGWAMTPVEVEITTVTTHVFADAAW